MTVPVEFLHPQATHDHIGDIPLWLNETDPRSAKEQLNAGYRHGGGWNPMRGLTMKGTTLWYPGDPPFKAIARMNLREEMILVYEHSIFAIVQRDGSFEAARMD